MLGSSGAAAEKGDDSKSAPKSTKPSSSHPAMSPIQQGLGGSQLSLKQQTQLLTPKAFFESISTQLLGEVTPQQKEAQQKEAQKMSQRIAQAQQDWQSYQTQQKALEDQRVQKTIELKDQALKVGDYDKTSAVKSQTTQGDLSEQSLVELAMKNAQEAKQREQRARAAMSVSATPKGAQAEGGQKKTSTFAQMQNGGEQGDNKALKDTQDARQRQREQAMGE